MKLTTIQPEVINSSLEPKAWQTAEIIGKELNLDSLAVARLQEHDRSNSPFYPQDKFRSQIKDFFEKPHLLIFGSESADQAPRRFRYAVESTTASYGDKTVLVVAHGPVISLYVSFLTGIDGYWLWQDLELPSHVTLAMRSRSLAELVKIP